jgi:serine/threonine protein kinase/Tfp pilus assembly protein PilF
VERELELGDVSGEVLSEAAQDRLARILDEYLVAAERGEPINPDELLRRYPEDAKYLRGYLSGLQKFHAEAGGLMSRQASLVGRMQPAQVIGDFRLLREIGRGGMGVVYDAWQISLERRVALKILPFTAGHDDKQIRRFRNEALAAAHVEHANIVPVYAVGEDNGVHYYAMQLIEGQSLATMLAELRATHGSRTTESTVADCQRTTWGDQPGGKWTNTPQGPLRQPAVSRVRATGERIRFVARLGIQAAEALHAAHEIGVVHRDVKPSNLLLDAQDKLWVTDFGLARCRENEGLTQSGDVLGTMRYMSPEQALGRGELIDHRSDVYSLGVTLYELATGHHPAGELTDAQLVLNRGEFHHKSLRHWNGEIPRDFETIVMKAISEFPYERYATAQKLADDLRRFLDGRPILASRPRLMHRAGKWARRHRGYVYSIAATLLLVFIGQSINSLLLVRKNHEIATALATARDSLHDRGTVLDRFSTQLVDQLAAIPGAEGARYQLLEDSLGLYERFEAQAADDPAFAADLALAYSKMGTLSEKLGKQSAALDKHLAARDLWRARVAAEPANREYALNLALCQNNVGLLLADAGRHDEAMETFQSAVRSLEKLTAAEPTSQAFAAALATTYGNFGLVLEKRGEHVAAAQRFRDAISIHEEIVKRSPDSESTLHSLAACYANLASLSAVSGQDVAVDNYRKAIEIQRRLVERWPINRIYQGDLARTYNNLGFVLIGRHDFRQGELCYRNSVAIQENLVKASPFAVCYRRDLAISYNNLGMAQSRFERFSDAEKSFRRALELQQHLLDVQPDDAKTLSDAGGMHNNLGLLLDRLNRFDDADAAYQQAIRLQRTAFDAAPEVSQYRKLLHNHYVNYAKSLRIQNKRLDADKVTQERNTLLAGSH